MVQDIIKKIKKDFGCGQIHSAVHELSHAVYAVYNGYKVKSVLFETVYKNRKKIDGKVEINFLKDEELFKDLESINFQNKFTRYVNKGKLYVKLLLIGYVAEAELLDLNMEFRLNEYIPSTGFDSIFATTEDGRKCSLILANNLSYKLGMPQTLSSYHCDVKNLVNNKNFKTIIKKLLIKTFYHDLCICKIKNCKPALKNLVTINKLLEKYPL